MPSWCVLSLPCLPLNRLVVQRETVMFSEAELLSCLTHLEEENKLKLMWRDGIVTFIGSHSSILPTSASRRAQACFIDVAVGLCAAKHRGGPRVDAPRYATYGTPCVGKRGSVLDCLSPRHGARGESIVV